MYVACEIRILCFVKFTILQHTNTHTYHPTTTTTNKNHHENTIVREELTKAEFLVAEAMYSGMVDLNSILELG